MNKLKLNRLFVKGYAATWMVAVLTTLYAYVGWPVKPRMPVITELHAVIGKPLYRHSLATKSAIGVDYFMVNDIRLNCSFGHLGGLGGCGSFIDSIDRKKNVRATYFWMRTRLWFGDRMLHTLEQEERLIVSPQQSYTERMRNYRSWWKSYRQLLFFGVVVTIVLWFIEKLNVKRRLNCLDRVCSMRNLRKGEWG